jgi:hypothetical protein
MEMTPWTWTKGREREQLEMKWGLTGDKRN